MWTYYPELLAAPVPRYTSYPTAAEFHDVVGATEQREGLAAVGDEEAISLYIHIPYCREICWYCGCNTGRANRHHRLTNYLSALKQEVSLVAEQLAGRGRVARVSFGGGSPNAISAEQFTALAASLRGTFHIDDDAIWSVEVDPRGFDAAFAGALGQVGVTRASLGVQTFDPAIQAAIGRVQPASVIQRSVDLLRDVGVASLNFDLMFGLPGQALEALRDSLVSADALGADRLAVFGYAHVPQLIPRQRRIDDSALPDARARFRMAEMAHLFLTGRGWDAIGFDHFARPDDPLSEAARQFRVRRNFQGFTDDPCDTLIGLGASSISRFKNALVQNEKSSGRYGLLVGNDRLAGVKGIATPRSERRRARIIEQLLANSSACLGDLVDDPAIRKRLAPFLERGLVFLNLDWLTLAPTGLPYARTIAAVFDPWRAESARTFSSAI